MIIFTVKFLNNALQLKISYWSEFLSIGNVLDEQNNYYYIVSFKHTQEMNEIYNKIWFGLFAYYLWIKVKLYFLRMLL